MVSFDCNNLVMELSFDSIDTPALTKSELAAMLFEQIGLNKREAKDFIDSFFGQIANQLVEGQDVKISGFGNFQAKTKQERPGRNPRTGETVIVKARRSVTFHASAKLKDAIQSDTPVGTQVPQ